MDAFLFSIRFHEVLKTLTDSDEGKLHILRVLYDFWRNHPQVGSIIQTSYFMLYCLIACQPWHLWELMLSMYSFRWSPCWWTSWFGPRSWTVQLCPTGYFLLKWLMISPGKPAEHTYLCKWGHCSCNWFAFIGSMQVLCVGDSPFHHPEDEQTRAEDSERVGWGKRKAGEATQQKGREKDTCACGLLFKPHGTLIHFFVILIFGIACSSLLLL